MPICKALIKFGYSSFSLEILEYCEPDQLIQREGDFIKLFSPEYNIIQDPTLPPMSGRKHSEEAIKKISNSTQGRKHTEETLKKLAVPHAGQFKKGGVRPKGLEVPLWLASLKK
jgi:group I intron endonuclease